MAERTPGGPVSVELPSQVVWILNVIGVNWPNVDEDQVRLFAAHVDEFAKNIDSTHQAASSTITQIGESYQGSSYDQLVQAWAQRTNQHMTELVDTCHTVATALEVAADTIVAAKIAAIGELVALAITFAADQAAAVATLGLAEAAEALVIATGKKIINGLIQQLEQHIIGEVIGAAVEPLEEVVERAVGGLAYKAIAAELGAPSSTGSIGPSVTMMPDDLTRHAQTMSGHAATVSNHAQTFAGALSAVRFE